MRKIIPSLALFIAAFALFSTVVYAWFALSSQNDVEPVSLEVIDSDVDLTVEYGRNGGSYESFNDPADLNAYLSSTLPGDMINIKVTVANNNPTIAPDMLIALELLNIRSSETDIIYDLTDFFFLENANIKLTWYENLTELSVNNPYLIQNIELTPMDPTIINYQGIDLETYRLSNMFNHYEEGELTIIENNISILGETPLPSQHILVIEFNIGLDAYTPDQGGFQNGELLIDGLYSLMDQES
jgi:hypothetical protein